MSDLPTNLQYTRSHEWVRTDDDGTLVIGVTDHAQRALGDIVYLELPEAGSTIESGDACAVIESVKAASDIYAPVSGEVIENNAALTEQPETVNSAPYDSWLFRIKPSAPLENLLDASAYAAEIADE